jgi:Zn-dependent protease
MSDLILPGKADEARERTPVSPIPAPPSTTTGLPPEVEAELRARMGLGAPIEGEGASGEVEPAAPTRRTLSERLEAWGSFGTFLVFLITKLKFLAFLLPVVKTGGSMFLSAWAYASRDGWPFAVWFVIGIFVHEMGHVLTMWRYGYKLSAPLFIPGMGALIFDRNHQESAWKSAVIGIGGPIAGTLAGMAFYIAWLKTGDSLWESVAYWTFLINLFNMIPLGFFDGGRVAGAISPRIWLVGLLMMGGMVLTGFVRNPLIFILIFLSLPTIIHGLKTGDHRVLGQEPATVRQKQILGVGYVGLIAVMWWFLAHLHAPDYLK